MTQKDALRIFIQEAVRIIPTTPLYCSNNSPMINIAKGEYECLLVTARLHRENEMEIPSVFYSKCKDAILENPDIYNHPIVFPAYIKHSTYSNISSFVTLIDTLVYADEHRLFRIKYKNNIYYGNNTMLLDENFRIIMMVTVKSLDSAHLTHKHLLYVNPSVFDSKDSSRIESVLRKNILEVMKYMPRVPLIIQDVTSEFILSLTTNTNRTIVNLDPEVMEANQYAYMRENFQTLTQLVYDVPDFEVEDEEEIVENQNNLLVYQGDY